MSINISPSCSQASARSITEMANLNHGAGRGSHVVNLANRRELDQNLRIAEKAGGPEDVYGANTRESCSHKDAQNSPIFSNFSHSPMSQLGTELPARVSGDGCFRGVQVEDTSRGDPSENKMSKTQFLSSSDGGGGWRGDHGEEKVSVLLVIAPYPDHRRRAPEIQLYSSAQNLMGFLTFDSC